MKMRTLKQISLPFYVLIFFIIFLMSSHSVHAEIVGESFSQYHAKVEFLDNDIIRISKDLALKNNHNRAILPGQIEFRIGSGTMDTSTSVVLDNIRVQDNFGRNISYSFREFEQYSSLIVDVFYPLLPGFEYRFSLQYELEYESRGIFFKSLQIPLTESSIPIEEGRFEVILPRNNFFTYTGELGNLATISGNEGVWELGDSLPNKVEFEYSFIPLRTPWLRGSYMFWIIVNLMMFIFLVLQIRKEVVRVRSQEE